MGVLCLAMLASVWVWGQNQGASGIPAAGQERVPGTILASPMGVPAAGNTEIVPGQKSAGDIQRDIERVAADGGLATSVWEWKGRVVSAIEFEGVKFDAKDPLLGKLAQKVGAPLDPDDVRQTTRRLFATGLYRDISVRGVRHEDSVALVFVGSPRYYVGRVTIEGVRDEQFTSMLEFATKLQPGTGFTRSAVPAGTDGILETLQQSGYFQPKVSVKTAIDAVGDQVNVTYTVDTGPQAKVGSVSLKGGDPGLTAEEFRKQAKLKPKSKVTRDTVSNALSRLRAQYQKKDRLEATVTMQKQTYDPVRKRVDYQFTANQGPVVKVLVEGANLSKSRLKLLVPVFEEGTIDNDLLNEGTHNIREFLVQDGYFDAAVEVKVIGEDTPSERVIYTVDKGPKHKVLAVRTKGNKYFSDDILRERMKIQKADLYMRSGRYSPGLVTQDVSAILALYKANGFDHATVQTDVNDVDIDPSGKTLKVAQIKVTYMITEGTQQRFGAVNLVGVDGGREQEVRSLLNSQAGQPFSLITLSGDRDAVLGYYLSRGFDKARVEIYQSQEKDAAKTDVTLNITEGEQVFVNHVLVSGIVHTQPGVVTNQILVHPGEPLDQNALLETQRNLYNLALFNEVVTAVQNPTGDAPRKNTIVQVTEAKRWDVTYGFGFEAETGVPQTGQISEASKIQLGLNPSVQYNQNGKAGVSPRVSLDVSRINLRGTENSLALHGTYGLLEQVATLTFTNPHLRGSRNFSALVSGGYSNVQDITTFAAKTLQADFRVTEKFRRRDTFLYDFEYRRVQVDPNSLQVSANLIPLLSQPVRVGGPGLTWFHDTRDPTPLDATKGSYTSLQEFLASSKFGSQTDFNRIDVSNSTYYAFGKHKYVLARNTRMGVERDFGVNPNVGNSACAVGPPSAPNLLKTNPSCNAVPLPERLYAGGSNSHRGFAINGAGPRDLQTGYPVGGSAVFVNSTELRLPPETLPYVGDNVSLVLFHDMGNVFQNVSSMFPSFLRVTQPDSESCHDVSGSIGKCNFNYFSHAVGMGARYKTPVGPIRVDFSYNLNPPIYPVIYDFNGSLPYTGQAPHFNFFFSIGQSF